MSPLQLLSS